MSSSSREKRGRFSTEVRDRFIRLVQEQTPQHSSQWAAITTIAPKLGCTKETLRRWVREAERDAGWRPGPMRADEDRIKALERENRELGSYYASDTSPDLSVYAGSSNSSQTLEATATDANGRPVTGSQIVYMGSGFGDVDPC
jgi:transposase-like protein